MQLSSFAPLFSSGAQPPGRQLTQMPTGIVLQRLQTPEGVFGGLIACASVHDLTRGVILPHESILAERFVSIARALQENMMMSEPILLGYERQSEVAHICETWIDQNPADLTRSGKSIKDEYWLLDDLEKVRTILKNLQGLEHVYVADGHHRLGAVKHLFDQGVLKSPRFLAACYSFKNLRIHAYHRAVASQYSLAQILNKIGEVAKIVRLDQLELPTLSHEVVVQYQDTYWQANFSAESADVLPAGLFDRVILKGVFGIQDATSSNSITYYSDNEQLAMQNHLRAHTESVGFYLAPVRAAQFMNFCLRGQMMPPKSTYFTPRMPKEAVFQLLEG